MLTSMTRREALVTLAAGACTAPALTSQLAADVLTVVILDPLAAPLSCPCVKGYAQRDYEKLAKFLEPKLGRPVRLHFSESLPHALAKLTAGRADLVIGKDSVVRAGAQAAKLALTPVASLTDKTGKTTQTGLFVVANADPALTSGDLKGYRMLFGPADYDEKHGAALTLLKELGLPVPATPETCVSCSVGSTKVLDLHKNGEKVATVISSYALPLLEGCDTIKKGDLRVVGETDPVPFITAFVNERLGEAVRAKLRAALLAVADETGLCTALETKLGFVAPATGGVKKKQRSLITATGQAGAALTATAGSPGCRTSCPLCPDRSGKWN